MRDQGQGEIKVGERSKSRRGQSQGEVKVKERLKTMRGQRQGEVKFKERSGSRRDQLIKEIFLSPGQDRVVTIKSRNFFYCESLVLSGFLY